MKYCFVVLTLLVFFLAATLSPSPLLAAPMLAKPLTVIIDHKSYEVNLSKDRLSFSERGFAKTIQKQKCNRVLFERLATDLERSQAALSDFKGTGTSAGVIQVTSGSTTQFAFRNRREGRFLASVPAKVKNLWLTSERVCAQ